MTSATRTVPAVLDRIAAQLSEHDALVTPDKRLTYGQLRDEVRRAAAAMIDMGVAVGDRVARMRRSRNDGSGISISRPPCSSGQPRQVSPAAARCWFHARRSSNASCSRPGPPRPLSAAYSPTRLSASHCRTSARKSSTSITLVG